MKLKKWLSRGLVLAMVLALMVPVPVAAKSSKAGGKLVKSVEYYDVNTAGKWQLSSKTTYTYDKKKNPKEIKNTYFGQYWLGVPVSGGSSVATAKYKYKGSTPKSMVLKDDAGFVISKRTYKGGKLVSEVRENKWATEQKNGTVNSGIETTTTFATYFKNGLASATSEQFSNAYAEGTTGSTSAHAENTAYAYMEKKGIPSLVISSYSYQDKEGNSDPYTEYTRFNEKGLAVESGRFDSKTGKYTPEVSIAYTMSKGNVKEAVICTVAENGSLAPAAMIKFKYAKTKISKTRYMNMINSLLPDWVESSDAEAETVHSFFNWY